ncbi:MAG: glycoside hydrolase family 2 protein [Rhizobiales bacterium]|nr:glycoside hydrolase family 2 protein [Hyphomicrobiales bacterium]
MAPAPANRSRLDHGWRMLQSAPGRYADPAAIPEDADWIAAKAPDTAAAALERAGRFDRDAPVDLDEFDHWWRCEFDAAAPQRLVFHGLATLAEIFVNGERRATGESMFAPMTLDLRENGRVRLDIAFRGMGPRLAVKTARARWRPRAVQPPSLRFLRATLIGRMPGWCPPIRAVGPYRAVELIDDGALQIDVVRALTRVEGRDGVVDVALRVNRDAVAIELSCAGARHRVAVRDGWASATLRIPDIALWWPHTHGAPVLHDLAATVEGREIALARLGFRTIQLDRGPDGKGFGLRVNGVPVFCRGANWISADIVALPGARADYAPWLTLARDAHMNMIRVPGSTLYEASDFYALCDELGLMVWQDFMFANLDYPANDADFRAAVWREAEAFVRRTQASPSLAVFCGGAEVAQQAAMLGLPRETWSNAIFDEDLPGVLQANRPGAVYVPNTPCFGDLPFTPEEGLCHYYGVSAYGRDFDDVRRSRVRFAPECLGFSHAPERDVPLEPGRAAIAQPIYGERIEGDTGAVWYFEDVRNAYLQRLYGVDPQTLRREDPARWLDLSRATTCEVATGLFAELRSPRSLAQGAMTLFFQDVAGPGAGWGVVDHRCEPKPVWHALRRAFRPLSVSIVDEGLNGLAIVAFNDGPHRRTLDLVFECLRDGEIPVLSARRGVTLEPHGVAELSSSDLAGGFFDASYAYRFGPPQHDVAIARLVDPATQEIVADAFFFPVGRGAARAPLGLDATAERLGDAVLLTLSTLRLAQNVRILAPGWRASDNWLHLAPRAPRRIVLQAVGDAPMPTRVAITALNGLDALELQP